MASRRNGRALAFATAPVRCAIYTRKSTDEGLDRDFNSLDNQRERGEAFVVSQGWSTLPERYDDGGFSGGTVERPALKRLLADVEAGRIDTFVVYKLDRLSRSLVHFGRIHEFLEKHNVALVSVTESINTSTPHGRMMVNVLLSFAQYERELVGERTRDKLQAQRRKGKFTGGSLILGYDRDPGGGRLVVNDAEAEQVREIFRLFLETRSLVATAAELNRRGWTLKRWTTKGGNVVGGTTFDRVNLQRMLANHTYVGKVAFQGTVYDGEHEGIVPQKIFCEAQRVLSENTGGGTSERNRHGSLLRGLLRCSACDRAMTHTWTRTRTRLHRYYTCQRAQKEGHAACPTKSVPADRLEQFVVDQIRRIGADPELQQATFRQAVQQLQAQRRGLKAEGKRLERDLAAAHGDVRRLVDAVSRTTGTAAEAIQAELAQAQERTTTIEARLAEVRAQDVGLDGQTVDSADVARALEAFDPVWDVLLTPERERVLRLLIENIDYRGDTGELAITWRLAGFGELAAEVAP
jgi:site-specific DNA recombinase